MLSPDLCKCQHAVGRLAEWARCACMVSTIAQTLHTKNLFKYLNYEIKLPLL